MGRDLRGKIMVEPIWCMKCRKKQPVANWIKDVTEKGMGYTQGYCEVCGTKVQVFTGKVENPKSAKVEENAKLRLEQDIETLKKEQEQKVILPPQLEKVEDASMQNPPSHSSTFKKEAGDVWSAFVVITVALALVTTGNIWALSALGFLIFRLEAFSKGIILVAESVGAPFKALGGWASRRSKIAELAKERAEFEKEKIEFAKREEGLIEELEEFAKIRQLAREEIEKLTSELKADDIRTMYQKEIQKRNEFEKDLIGDFTRFMKIISPLVEDFPLLLKVMEREKEREAQTSS
jgi:hypothetical protein